MTCCTMSMLNSFWYCGTSAFFGSIRTWTSIASEREWNGIRIGKRPTNSGIIPNSMRSRASTCKTSSVVATWHQTHPLITVTALHSNMIQLSPCINHCHSFPLNLQPNCSITSYFTKYLSVCPLPTLTSHLLAKPSFCTSLGRRTFSYAAPQIWNAIHLNIRNSPSVGSFKRNFKTFYFAAAF